MQHPSILRAMCGGRRKSSDQVVAVYEMATDAAGNGLLIEMGGDSQWVAIADGPRGGKRWRHKVSGKIAYKAPGGAKGGAAVSKKPAAKRSPRVVRGPSPAAQKKAADAKVIAGMAGKKDGLYKIQGGAGTQVIQVQGGKAKILTEKQAVAASRKATPKKPPAKVASRVAAREKPAPKGTPAKKASRKSADPMDGHPLAGKTRAEMVQSLIKDGADGPGDFNPRGYDKMPEGIDAEKFKGDVLGYVTEAKKKLGMARPKLKDLYDAVKEKHPGLTLHKFQQAMAALHKDGEVRLGAHSQALEGTQAETKDGPRIKIISDEEMPHLIPMGRNINRYVELGDEDTRRAGKERREQQADDEARAARRKAAATAGS